MLKILIATVGGSHQPIITAIKQLQPSYSCFFCSDHDPVTGQIGSRQQIDGTGLIIKRHPADPEPSLPSIPKQLNMSSDQYEIVLVPTDDLDTAVEAMGEAILRLKSIFPEAEIYANYTGGTKSMTAALVLSTLEHQSVHLQLVTGVRSNLTKISSEIEPEHVTSATIERIKKRLANGIE